MRKKSDGGSIRKARVIMKRWILSGVIGLLVITLSFSAGGARADTSGCVSAGSTGLTAAVIATSNEVISGTVDGTGCNVGVYVGPGITGVLIKGAMISGAMDHGIFAQDTSGLVVMGSTIVGNGVHPHSCDIPGNDPCIAEDKAVQLVGTSNSLIAKNNVSLNGFGGIGIADDGPGIDPGAFNPGSASPAVGNVVVGNMVLMNFNDCGIVVAAYNAGVGAANNAIVGNLVTGNLPPFLPGKADGQIVVATDGPSTSVMNTVVANNRIAGSELPGIVVHSNAPGDVISGTVLVRNTISNSGYYPSFFSTPNTPNSVPTGISLVAEVGSGAPQDPVLTGTLVVSDTVTSNSIGLWLCGTTGTLVAHFQTTAATPMTACAAGGN